MQARNRVFMPAHNVSLPPDDTLSLYLAERARGGVGLIIAGAFPVHPTRRAARRRPGIRPGPTPCARSQPARDLGVPVLAQIFTWRQRHAAQLTTSRTGVRWYALGHSLAPHRAVPQVLLGRRHPRADRALRRSAHATRWVVPDGVEIQWLARLPAGQLLSPWWNRRDDD